MRKILIKTFNGIFRHYKVKNVYKYTKHKEGRKTFYEKIGDKKVIYKIYFNHVKDKELNPTVSNSLYEFCALIKEKNIERAKNHVEKIFYEQYGLEAYYKTEGIEYVETTVEDGWYFGARFSEKDKPERFAILDYSQWNSKRAIALSTRYIGIDIDTPELKAHPEGAEITRSPSGRGWHIKLYQRVETIAQHFAIRAMYFDDPVRLKLDKLRHKAGAMFNVLFDKKW